jgi:hypothetical protein
MPHTVNLQFKTAMMSVVAAYSCHIMGKMALAKTTITHLKNKRAMLFKLITCKSEMLLLYIGIWMHIHKMY